MKIRIKRQNSFLYGKMSFWERIKKWIKKQNLGR